MENPNNIPKSKTELKSNGAHPETTPESNGTHSNGAPPPSPGTVRLEAIIDNAKDFDQSSKPRLARVFIKVYLLLEKFLEPLKNRTPLLSQEDLETLYDAHFYLVEQCKDHLLDKFPTDDTHPEMRTLLLELNNLDSFLKKEKGKSVTQKLTSLLPNYNPKKQLAEHIAKIATSYSNIFLGTDYFLSASKDRPLDIRELTFQDVNELDKYLKQELKNALKEIKSNTKNESKEEKKSKNNKKKNKTVRLDINTKTLLTLVYQLRDAAKEVELPKFSLVDSLTPEDRALAEEMLRAQKENDETTATTTAALDAMANGNGETDPLLGSKAKGNQPPPPPPREKKQQSPVQKKEPIRISKIVLNINTVLAAAYEKFSNQATRPEAPLNVAVLFDSANRINLGEGEGTSLGSIWGHLADQIKNLGKIVPKNHFINPLKPRVETGPQLNQRVKHLQRLLLEINPKKKNNQKNKNDPKVVLTLFCAIVENLQDLLGQGAKVLADEDPNFKVKNEDFVTQKIRLPNFGIPGRDNPGTLLAELKQTANHFGITAEDIRAYEFAASTFNRNKDELKPTPVVKSYHDQVNDILISCTAVLQEAINQNLNPQELFEKMGRVQKLVDPFTDKYKSTPKHQKNISIYDANINALFNRFHLENDPLYELKVLTGIWQTFVDLNTFLMTLPNGNNLIATDNYGRFSKALDLLYSDKLANKQGDNADKFIAERNALIEQARKAKEEKKPTSSSSSKEEIPNPLPAPAMPAKPQVDLVKVAANLKRIEIESEKVKETMDPLPWGDDDGIYNALRQEIGDKVDIVKAELGSIHSIFPQGTDPTSQANAKEAWLNYCKALAGYQRGDYLVENGVIQNENPTKPVILILNTGKVQTSSKTNGNVSGGKHFLVTVVLPKNYCANLPKDIRPAELPADDGKVRVLTFDSLGVYDLPPEFTKLLTTGTKHEFTVEDYKDISGTVTNQAQITHTIPAALPPNTVFACPNVRQQIGNGDDCAWWSYYNAIKTVVTGGSDFCKPQTNRQLALALRKNVPGIKEKPARNSKSPIAAKGPFVQFRDFLTAKPAIDSYLQMIGESLESLHAEMQNPNETIDLLDEFFAILKKNYSTSFFYPTKKVQELQTQYDEIKKAKLKALAVPRNASQYAVMPSVSQRNLTTKQSQLRHQPSVKDLAKESLSRKTGQQITGTLVQNNLLESHFRKIDELYKSAKKLDEKPKEKQTPEKQAILEKMQFHQQSATTLMQNPQLAKQFAVQFNSMSSQVKEIQDSLPAAPRSKLVKAPSVRNLGGDYKSVPTFQAEHKKADLAKKESKKEEESTEDPWDEIWIRDGEVNIEGLFSISDTKTLTERKTSLENHLITLEKAKKNKGLKPSSNPSEKEKIVLRQTQEIETGIEILTNVLNFRAQWENFKDNSVNASFFAITNLIVEINKIIESNQYDDPFKVRLIRERIKAINVHVHRLGGFASNTPFFNEEKITINWAPFNEFLKEKGRKNFVKDCIQKLEALNQLALGLEEINTRWNTYNSEPLSPGVFLTPINEWLTYAHTLAIAVNGCNAISKNKSRVTDNNKLLDNEFQAILDTQARLYALNEGNIKTETKKLGQFLRDIKKEWDPIEDLLKKGDLSPSQQEVLLYKAEKMQQLCTYWLDRLDFHEIYSQFHRDQQRNVNYQAQTVHIKTCIRNGFRGFQKLSDIEKWLALRLYVQDLKNHCDDIVDQYKEKFIDADGLLVERDKPKLYNDTQQFVHDAFHKGCKGQSPTQHLDTVQVLIAEINQLIAQGDKKQALETINNELIPILKFLENVYKACTSDFRNEDLVEKYTAAKNQKEKGFLDFFEHCFPDIKKDIADWEKTAKILELQITPALPDPVPNSSIGPAPYEILAAFLSTHFSSWKEEDSQDPNKVAELISNCLKASDYIEQFIANYIAHDLPQGLPVPNILAEITLPSADSGFLDNPNSAITSLGKQLLNIADARKVQVVYEDLKRLKLSALALRNVASFMQTVLKKLPNNNYPTSTHPEKTHEGFSVLPLAKPVRIQRQSTRTLSKRNLQNEGKKEEILMELPDSGDPVPIKTDEINFGSHYSLKPNSSYQSLSPSKKREYLSDEEEETLLRDKTKSLKKDSNPPLRPSGPDNPLLKPMHATVDIIKSVPPLVEEKAKVKILETDETKPLLGSAKTKNKKADKKAINTKTTAEIALEQSASQRAAAQLAYSRIDAQLTTLIKDTAIRWKKTKMFATWAALTGVGVGLSIGIAAFFTAGVALVHPGWWYWTAVLAPLFAVGGTLLIFEIYQRLAKKEVAEITELKQILGEGENAIEAFKKQPVINYANKILYNLNQTDKAKNGKLLHKIDASEDLSEEEQNRLATIKNERTEALMMLDLVIGERSLKSSLEVAGHCIIGQLKGFTGYHIDWYGKYVKNANVQTDENGNKFHVYNNQKIPCREIPGDYAAIDITQTQEIYEQIIKSAYKYGKSELLSKLWEVIVQGGALDRVGLPKELDYSLPRAINNDERSDPRFLLLKFSWKKIRDMGEQFLVDVLLNPHLNDPQSKAQTEATQERILTLFSPHIRSKDEGINIEIDGIKKETLQILIQNNALQPVIGYLVSKNFNGNYNWFNEPNNPVFSTDIPEVIRIYNDREDPSLVPLANQLNFNIRKVRAQPNVDGHYHHDADEVHWGIFCRIIEDNLDIQNGVMVNPDENRIIEFLRALNKENRDLFWKEHTKKREKDTYQFNNIGRLIGQIVVHIKDQRQQILIAAKIEEIIKKAFSIHEDYRTEHLFSDLVKNYLDAKDKVAESKQLPDFKPANAAVQDFVFYQLENNGYEYVREFLQKILRDKIKVHYKDKNNPRDIGPDDNIKAEIANTVLNMAYNYANPENNYTPLVQDIAKTRSDFGKLLATLAHPTQGGIPYLPGRPCKKLLDHLSPIIDPNSPENSPRILFSASTILLEAMDTLSQTKAKEVFNNILVQEINQAKDAEFAAFDITLKFVFSVIAAPETTLSTSRKDRLKDYLDNFNAASATAKLRGMESASVDIYRSLMTGNAEHNLRSPVSAQLLERFVKVYKVTNYGKLTLFFKGFSPSRKEVRKALQEIMGAAYPLENTDDIHQRLRHLFEALADQTIAKNIFNRAMDSFAGDKSKESIDRRKAIFSAYLNYLENIKEGKEELEQNFFTSTISGHKDINDKKTRKEQKKINEKLVKQMAQWLIDLTKSDFPPLDIAARVSPIFQKIYELDSNALNPLGHNNSVVKILNTMEQQAKGSARKLLHTLQRADTPQTLQNLIATLEDNNYKTYFDQYVPALMLAITNNSSMNIINETIFDRYLEGLPEEQKGNAIFALLANMETRKIDIGAGNSLFGSGFVSRLLDIIIAAQNSSDEPVSKYREPIEKFVLFNQRQRLFTDILLTPKRSFVNLELAMLGDTSNKQSIENNAKNLFKQMENSIRLYDLKTLDVQTGQPVPYAIGNFAIKLVTDVSKKVSQTAAETVVETYLTPLPKHEKLPAAEALKKAVEHIKIDSNPSGIGLFGGKVLYNVANPNYKEIAKIFLTQYEQVKLAKKELDLANAELKLAEKQRKEIETEIESVTEKNLAKSLPLRVAEATDEKKAKKKTQLTKAKTFHDHENAFHDWLNGVFIGLPFQNEKIYHPCVKNFLLSVLLQAGADSKEIFKTILKNYKNYTGFLNNPLIIKKLVASISKDLNDHKDKKLLLKAILCSDPELIQFMGINETQTIEHVGETFKTLVIQATKTNVPFFSSHVESSTRDAAINGCYDYLHSIPYNGPQDEDVPIPNYFEKFSNELLKVSAAKNKQNQLATIWLTARSKFSTTPALVLTSQEVDLINHQTIKTDKSNGSVEASVSESENHNPTKQEEDDNITDNSTTLPLNM